MTSHKQVVVLGDLVEAACPNAADEEWYSPKRVSSTVAD